MRTFIAGLGTESNSFSPIPTGERAFRETLFHRGDATQHAETLFSGPLQVASVAGIGAAWPRRAAAR